MPRPISYLTYKQFAKEYRIKLSSIINGKRKLKTMKQLANEIYKFETDNMNTIQNKMLYYY